MKSRNLYHNSKAQWAVYAVFFILVLAVPAVIDDSFTLNLLATYGVFAMLALSVSMAWGAGGVLTLGQGVPFGLAAYCMAMTMQMQAQSPDNPMPPFMANNSLTNLPLMWEPFKSTTVGLLIAVFFPTILWMLFGGLMFAARVSGGFVAVMTLAMLSAIGLLVLDIQPYTNGANGITPPNALVIAGHTIDPYSTTAYLIVAISLTILAGLSKALLSGKFGLVTHAIRTDAERTRFLGYNVFLYQTLLFGIAGLIASIAGCLFVMLVQYVSPAQLDVSFSVGMVIWAGVGGRASLLWAMLGALLINAGQTVVGDTLLNTWLLCLGIFFILVVRFLPSGLASIAEWLIGLFGRQRAPELHSEAEPAHEGG
jgi:urea transport system permease protein